MLKIMTAKSTLIAIACALSISAHAMADGTKRAINIPPSDLAVALELLAKQSGVDLVYRPEQVQGFKTNGIKGELSIEEAVRQLLRGTLLTVNTDSTGAMMIAAPLTSPRQSSSTTDSPVSSSSQRTATEEGSSFWSRFRVAQADTNQAPENSIPTGNSESQDIEHPYQSNPVELQEIVVTGSHIRGVTSTGANVIVLDREYIEQSGYSTVQDVIKTMPQNFGGGASEDFNTDVGNFNNGTAVNLRGVGADATLVLINGRRQPAGGTLGQFVDISTIPSAAVERIEVLPDGASAIYGSDAVGGVVNIVLRRDLSGAETNARFGTLGGDADEILASQLLGQRWTQGNVLIGYQFRQRDALPRSARPYSADTDQRRFGGSNFSSTSSSPGNILDPVTRLPAFAIPAGQDGRSLEPGDLLPGMTNYQNGALGVDLVGWERMHSAFVAGTWQPSERLELSVDGRYSKRDILRHIRGFGTVVRVPSTNPFFVDPFGGQSSIRVDYNLLNDLGPVTGRGETETYSATTGAKLKVGPAWQIALTSSYGDERTRWEGLNQPDSAALATALADPDPATALNVFGDGGDNNPATLDRIRLLQTEGGDADIWTIGWVADGPLFSLPGGLARLAIGADYREETLVTDATTATPSDLGRDVSAAFAEFALPFVGSDNARPGLSQLQLSLAARYEEYSDFGETFNPRVGLQWAPTSALTLRGTWGTSFKAPGLMELDETANADGLFPIPDPLSPTGFSPVLQRFGNNSTLKEETADTWTLGIDLVPEHWPNFGLSITYFDIDYKDRIVQPGPPGLSGILLQEDIWAAVITRSPSAEEVAAICNGPQFVFGDCTATPPTALVDFRRRNLAAVHVRGVDFALDHSIDTSRGTFGWGLTGSYVLGFEQSVTIAAPVVDFVDTLNNPLSLRLRAKLSWRRAAWDAAAFINYTGSYEESASAPTRRIGAWTSLDLSLGYRIAGGGLLDNTTLVLSAVNVFDEDPPFANVPEGYDRANADPFGRTLAVQVTKTW